jgi:hypothetical protein
MRRGDAQPRRAARLMTSANHELWSARAWPARVPREAPYPNPRAKAKLSLDVTFRVGGGV